MSPLLSCVIVLSPLTIFLILLAIKAIIIIVGDSNVTPMEQYRRNESEFIRNQSVRASMNHDRRHARVDMSFDTRAEIARRAIRVLPPFKTFKGDQITYCPICKEEFKKGELIQPFSLCAHEFHSSCLNSWLFGGKTTCPICRQNLSTVVHTKQRN